MVGFQVVGVIAAILSGVIAFFMLLNGGPVGQIFGAIMAVAFLLSLLLIAVGSAAHMISEAIKTLPRQPKLGLRAAEGDTIPVRQLEERK